MECVNTQNVLHFGGVYDFEKMGKMAFLDALVINTRVSKGNKISRTI